MKTLLFCRLGYPFHNAVWPVSLFPTNGFGGGLNNGFDDIHGQAIRLRTHLWTDVDVY